MAAEFVIYTDESEKNGEFFSNFYGGLLVRSVHLADACEQIRQAKRDQNLFGEIKWIKVTANYLEKCVTVIDSLFDLVAKDQIKIRVMFTNNTFVPKALTAEQRQSEYHRLYYQFIKHAFGLQYSDGEHPGQKRVRLNLDQMPTSDEETARFKSFVEGLCRNPEMRRARISFDSQQIAEVDSLDHDLLQCLDIVLGAMAFRLNNKNKVIQDGQYRRGKRTVAKEKLYKHILKRIRMIYPNFNIGESTGTQRVAANRWHHPYRHWKLIPRNHERDLSKKKP